MVNAYGEVIHKMSWISFIVNAGRGVGKIALIEMIDYLNEPIYVIKWNQFNLWGIDMVKVQPSTTREAF